MFNGEYIYYSAMMEWMDENVSRLTFQKDAEELRRAETQAARS